jgi:ankyrin repeat protein
MSAMTFDEAHRGIKRGNLSLLRKELEVGLNPNLSNRYSWTILMLAALAGNTRIGELLIEKGADLNLRNKFGDTALSLAAKSGHTSFVELLLRHGASLDCYPHGNSLDIFLSWIEEYAGNSSAQIKNIKRLFGDERKARVHWFW